MSRAVLWTVIGLLLLTGAAAQDIMIFTLEYDRGIISLKDFEVADGYYPDRRIQPEQAYNCSMYDDAGNLQYSFKFELPLRVYTDIAVNNEMGGTAVVLDQTEFSFIVPYNETAQLTCYNPAGYKIVEESLKEVPLSPAKPSWMWVYAAVALVGLLVVIKRSRSTSQ